jgi:hypothetical protein
MFYFFSFLRRNRPREARPAPINPTNGKGVAVLGSFPPLTVVGSSSVVVTVSFTGVSF